MERRAILRSFPTQVRLGIVASIPAPGPALADALHVAVLPFLALAVLHGVAAVRPAPLEPRASNADVGYTPRPEWCFLWLFQIGKYVEPAPWLRSAVVPGILVGALFALPLLGPAPAARRGTATRQEDETR